MHSRCYLNHTICINYDTDEKNDLQRDDKLLVYRTNSFLLGLFLFSRKINK